MAHDPKRDNERIIKVMKQHRIIDYRLLGYSRGKVPVELLVWGRPGTVVYRVQYMLYGGTLCVSGDMGEAVYRWYSNNITLSWIAGVNLSYFHEKCCASEGGRGYSWYSWDTEDFRKAVHGHFRDMKDCKGYKKFKESDFFRIDNWDEMQAAFYASDPHDIFGEDWYEWVPHAGRHIPYRSRFYLLGLRMAFGKMGRVDRFVKGKGGKR